MTKQKKLEVSETITTGELKGWGKPDKCKCGNPLSKHVEVDNLNDETSTWINAPCGGVRKYKHKKGG